MRISKSPAGCFAIRIVIVRRIWMRTMFELLTFKMQTVLSGLLVGLLVFYLLRRTKYRLPPGPWCLPLIGHYDVYTSPYIHNKMAKLSEKYGPVIRLSFGLTTTIVLNNTEVVTEALVKRKADFAGRPHIPSLHMTTDGGKDIVIATYSPKWKFHRKIAGKALREYLKGNLLENMIHENMTKFLDKMATETEPFFAKDYIDKLIFHQLYTMCFGEKRHIDDPEVDRLLELANELNETLGTGLLDDIVPFMKDIYPSARWRNLQRCNDSLQDIFSQKVKQHKESFDPRINRDFTDSMLMARIEAEKSGNDESIENLDDSYIIQTVFDIFFAGVDTSRMTLDWFICFLSALPEIQTKCQEEIDENIGSRVPTILDREKLPYTEACLFETLRLGNVSGIGVPHETICDTQVGGYDVPKGTTVLINHWALHHDSKYWKDVEKFDPHRYLDDNGKMYAKPESWLPFSAGRRVCLGESVAKPELLLICVHLLQRFRIMRPNGTQPTIENKPASFGTEIPANYKVIVTERK